MVELGSGAKIEIYCNEHKFEIPESLLPYMGEQINVLIEQQANESPDEPVRLLTEEVRIEDFERMIEFAKLFSQLTPDQQVLNIEKPLPSPDIKVWLKNHPTLHPFL